MGGSLFTGWLVQVTDLGLWVVFLECACVGCMSALIAGLMGLLTQPSRSSPSYDPPMHDSKAATPTERMAGLAELDDRQGRGDQIVRFLLSRQTAAFFFVVWSLGVGEGIMQTYTYVRMEKLPHGTPTVMGLSAVCMIVSEIPFFYYSGYMVNRCGLMPIVALALGCMFVRQMWIASIADAWWVLPGELLHGVTYSVANAAVVIYCREISPVSLRNTIQSIQFAVFSGFGWGFSTFIGGLVLRQWGVQTLFYASAVFALTTSALPVSVAIFSRSRG